MIRSRMAWVRVASPIRPRQRSTGIWLVISVAPRRNVLRRFPTCRGVLRPERLETPIVEHQELDAGEGAHQTRVATVAARQRKIAEHTRDALIEDRAIIAACLVAEGASQPAFADTGWPFDDQILCLLDPTASDQGLEECTIETTGGAVIDIFDRCLVA